MVRLGDGTRRIGGADEGCARRASGPTSPRSSRADEIDEQAVASGLGPRWADLGDDWRAEFADVIAAAGLALPAERPFRSTGKSGRHSEHLGYILAEMQHLQRAFPGGVW